MKETHDPGTTAVRLAVAIKRLRARLREATSASMPGLPISQLTILQHLRNGGPTTAAALATAEHVSQQAIAQNLKKLKDAGLVTDRREGRWSYYTLQPDAFSEAHDLVRALAAPQRAGRQSLKVFGACCG